MRNIFLLTIITLFIFGCSGSKDLKTQNQKTGSQLSLCQIKVTKLTADNELLNTKMVGLEKSNKNISAKLMECNDEISNLSSIYNSYNSKITKMRLELGAAFPNNMKDANFAIVEEDGRLIIRLPNRILYSSGSAEFNVEALMVIQKLATIIKDNEGLYLMVEGHTDDIPVRKGSKYEDNWDLSLHDLLRSSGKWSPMGYIPIELLRRDEQIMPRSTEE